MSDRSIKFGPAIAHLTFSIWPAAVNQRYLSPEANIAKRMGLLSVTDGIPPLAICRVMCCGLMAARFHGVGRPLQKTPAKRRWKGRLCGRLANDAHRPVL